MLVLTRKAGQRIFVGKEPIVITVLEIGPGKVQLGFEAPPAVIIYREEAKDRYDVPKENREPAN